MDRIVYFTDVSIRRGCGFGFLAIATSMVGLYTDVVLALRTGAMGVTLMMLILLLKGLNAPSRSYRHTEVWLLLDKSHGLPEQRAQQVFGSILRERYYWHATMTGLAALFLWLLAFVVHVTGWALQP